MPSCARLRESNKKPKCKESKTSNNESSLAQPDKDGAELQHDVLCNGKKAPRWRKFMVDETKPKCARLCDNTNESKLLVSIIGEEDRRPNQATPNTNGEHSEQAAFRRTENVPK